MGEQRQGAGAAVDGGEVPGPGDRRQQVPVPMYGFCICRQPRVSPKTTAKSGLLIRAGVPPCPRGLKNFVYLSAGGVPRRRQPATQTV